MSKLRAILALIIFSHSALIMADVPLVSIISGDGPFPLGTTTTEMMISTDVTSGCRYNDIDDGNLPQWTPFPSTDNLAHSVQVTLVNDQDTNRYIRCKNLSTNEVNSVSFVFTITFASDNAAPTISSVAVTSATEDVAYFYDVDATDADVGDLLTFSLSVFPAGMSIDPSSGAISWMPVNEQVGTQPVIVDVTDSGG
ncbi:MAG: Ig domain-containing protein [Kangiellaceae bacterium]|nr:Ig domain-containing protein [Kangiellaceae bacterium]